MSAKRPVYSGQYAIVGIGETAMGRAELGDTATALQAEAGRQAILDAGLKPGDVDAVFAQWDELGPAMAVSEYLGIKPRYLDSTGVGGQSNLTHIAHAIAAMEAGLCEVALITYGSTQRLNRSRVAGGYMARDTQSAAGQFIGPYGMLSPIGFIAMLTRLYMHRYGAVSEDLAQVVMTSRQWSALNPAAVRQEPLTLDEYMSAPMLADPLRKFDICQVTDSAGAIVLTHTDRARDLRRKPVTILGHAEQYSHYATPFGNHDWIEESPNVGLPALALERAGMRLDEIDMLQAYDAFTVNVLLSLEDCGLCARGEAPEFIRDGRIGPGGAFPVNTSGGGLSFNHGGMFGMALIIETVRQLRGDCGARQVKDAKHAMLTAGGLIMSAGMAMIMGSE